MPRTHSQTSTEVSSSLASHHHDEFTFILGRGVLVQSLNHDASCMMTLG